MKSCRMCTVAGGYLPLQFERSVGKANQPSPCPAVAYKISRSPYLTLQSQPGGAVSGSAGSSSHSSGGEREIDPVAIEELARACQSHEVMPLMMEHLKQVDFEARKDTAAVFCNFMRHDVAGWASAYMPQHVALLYQMVDGYSSPDLALHCGTMLRECVKLPPLHESLLYGPDGGISRPLRDLLESHVHDPNFEVAACAFETLTQVLTQNKPSVFAWLNPDGDAASLARCVPLRRRGLRRGASLYFLGVVILWLGGPRHLRTHSRP